ncbi:MAG: hypothetical protein RL026_319 [Pseudomonadota bacterium]|jgi:formate dehydrogenase subunit delta
MNTHSLVTMANDISAFFIGEAGEEAAPAQVANHINRFWDPRMRTAILAHARGSAEGLCAVAKAAALQVREPVVAA